MKTRIRPSDSFILRRALPYLAAFSLACLLITPLIPFQLHAAGSSTPVDAVMSRNGVVVSPTNFVTANALLTNSSPISASQLTGLGTGVLNSLQQTTNSPSGVMTQAAADTRYDALNAASLAVQKQAQYAVGPVQGVVIAWGDSITQGDGVAVGGNDTFPAWPYVLQGMPYFQNMSVYNLGRSGHTEVNGNSEYSSSIAYQGGTWGNRTLTAYTGSPHALATANAAVLKFAVDLYGINDAQQIAGIFNPIVCTGGSVTTANTIVSGLSSTASVIVGSYVVSRASVVLTSNNTNVSDGDTVTLGAVTYRFKTTPSQINDILIGASADASLTDLGYAIDGSNNRQAIGLYVYPGTQAHPLVYAGGVVSHAITITSKGQGTAANTIASTKSAATLTFASTTLLGSHYPENTTVASIDSSSQIHTSVAAIDIAAGVTLNFGSETLAQWQTTEGTANTNFHTDGCKVIRMTITPTVVGSVLLQTVIGQMNAYLVNPANVNTGTTTPDWCFDLNTYLGSCTTFLFADGLHPNAPGNYAIANFANDQASLVMTSYITSRVNPTAPGAIPDNSLSFNVPLLNANNTFVAPAAFSETFGGLGNAYNTCTFNLGSTLNLYSMGVGLFPGTIQFDAGNNGTLHVNGGALQIVGPYNSNNGAPILFSGFGQGSVNYEIPIKMAIASGLGGTVTLSSGAGTITSAAINTSSIIFLSQITASGASVYPQILIGSGSATVTGASTDNGTYRWALVRTY